MSQDPKVLRRAIDGWLRRNFVPYQLDWITDPSLFAVALKARQIGFSDATAGRAVYCGLVKRRPQLILSASQDLADEVLMKSRVHCRVLAASGFPQATNFSVDNATEIAWPNGGRVVALPANPRTARSFSGDVHLDEFAYHTDPEGIRDGAFAMATRGDYGIRVLSTPNGAQGLFYDWCTNPPEGWSFRRVTIDDAEQAGFPVNREKLLQLCGGDDRMFAQVYRCAFLDAQLQFIPTAMADRALRWEGRLPQIAGADIHAGLDVGRTNDLTALVILAVVGEVAYVVASLTCRRTDFRAQRRMIADAREMFRWQTLHVDQTGIGRGMAEELVEDWGDDEVLPIDFTLQAKADLATRALRWFRDDRLRFTRDAEGRALRDEVIAVQRVVTPSNNVTFDAPRSDRGHGDRWWALCLALKGAGEPQHVVEMGQVPLLAVA